MKNLRYRIPTALLTLCLSASIGLAQPLSTYAEESTDYTIETSINQTSADNTSDQTSAVNTSDQTSADNTSDQASSDNTSDQSAVSSAATSATTATTAATTATTAAKTTTATTKTSEAAEIPESQEVTNDTSDEDKNSVTEKQAEKESKVIKPTKAEIREKNLNRWMKACSSMLKDFKKYHFKYSNSGTKKSFKRAVSKRRRANCALYVSWCLQRYGATKGGSVFYVMGNGKLHKNFKWNKSKVQIIRVNKKVTSAHLKKGDIVCYKGIAHTNIYAGKDKKGRRLWYDGGKIATASNKNGSRYTHTGARSLSYLNKRTISYIIRIKNI